MSPDQHIVLSARDYNLDATLGSGQAFRWRQNGSAWTGVIGTRWVSLQLTNHLLTVRTAAPVTDWNWLLHYLQLEVDLNPVLASFPADDSMQAAVDACRGLRLLRQDHWECLASFILSSTKQIVQIQQIISLLCERYGDSVAIPDGAAPAHSFPSPERFAKLTEKELRDCKMGFRAPYLLATARAIAEGQLQLAALQKMPVAAARAELVRLPGVGPKIADCVLLFAYGFQEAFPVDVWVRKALRELYFPRRKPTESRLQRFTETYFGVNAGYAQQYLFHYMRTRKSLLADATTQIKPANKTL